MPGTMFPGTIVPIRLEPPAFFNYFGRCLRGTVSSNWPFYLARVVVEGVSAFLTVGAERSHAHLAAPSGLTRRLLSLAKWSFSVQRLVLDLPLSPPDGHPSINLCSNRPRKLRALQLVIRVRQQCSNRPRAIRSRPLYGCEDRLWLDGWRGLRSPKAA